jgi:hypothetical protein
MRKILFASAALAILAAAGTASAGNDTTNSQLNAFGAQISLNNLNDVSVRFNTDLQTQSVGNAVSISTDVARGSNPVWDDTSFASGQTNVMSLQRATTNVSFSGLEAVSIDTTAIGNTGSFESLQGDLGAKVWQDGVLIAGGAIYGEAATIAGAYKEGIAFQNNTASLQTATLNLSNSGIDRIDTATTAVGNNLAFSAPNGNASAVGYQLNLGTLQVATSNVNNIGVAGAAAFQTQSIGNIGSWSSANYGAADGINFQRNLGASQLSTSNIGFSGFNGTLSVGVIAAGNVANIGL